MPLPLKILLLSDAYSEHTEKWAIGLAKQQVEVGLFSFNKASYPWYKQHQNITVLFEPEIYSSGTSLIKKLSFLKYVGLLKKSIAIFKPNVLHAHYATSYGFIGALSGFHPFIISAWGTDVMKFPQKNFINRFILKYNLDKADAICATSFTIKKYLERVTKKNVHVIPFGVDCEIFKSKSVSGYFSTDTTVFGSIKPLEKIYNTDFLIKAFAVLSQKYQFYKTGLLIIGEGSQTEVLKKLVKDLNLQNRVVFTGRVPFSEIANFYNMLNIFVNISDYESFGVSVIEAMACEKVVIVTETGGLKEIVENATFGALVPVGDMESTVKEMGKYLLDESTRKVTGKCAREKVLFKYNWKDNIEAMLNVYRSLIKLPQN